MDSFGSGEGCCEHNTRRGTPQGHKELSDFQDEPCPIQGGIKERIFLRGTYHCDEDTQYVRITAIRHNYILLVCFMFHTATCFGSFTKTHHQAD